MSIKISGKFRVQEIYMGEKTAYVTIKDKEDGSICKVSHALPLPKGIVDDALVSLDGALKPRIYQGKVSLDFEGVVTSAPEK